MSRGKVTRDDVAKAAGTSVAVVSYVVNNGPRPVAPDTRNRVLAAIEETGYRPDSIARALASGSTRTYGLIVPNVANPFIASLAHAIEDAAFQRGLALLLGDSADDPLREAELVNTFLQHQIDGLIFYGVDRDHVWLEQALGRIPVVVLDDGDPLPGSAGVRVDERAAAAAATQHLIEHGYRRIGTIAGPLAQQNSQDRANGWRDALKTASMQPDEDLLIEADYTRTGGFNATEQFLGLSDRPDALFIANEQQSIGFLAAAHEAGVRVPEDIAIICFNGTTNGEYTIPALSTVEQPITEIAAHAVDLIAHGTTNPTTIICDFQLVTRRSCGCIYSRTRAPQPRPGATEVEL